MQSSIGRDKGPALKRDLERLPYEAPKIVYQGKITKEKRNGKMEPVTVKKYLTISSSVVCR